MPDLLKGWLKTRNDELFAPNILASNILTEHNESYVEYLESQFAKKPGLRVEGYAYTHDNKIYNAKEGAEAFNDPENNSAAGAFSHAEGYNTKALGDYSHAEGKDTVALGNYSHAEGFNNSTNGEGSSIGGLNNNASGTGTHVTGANNRVTGNYAHGEGFGVQVIGAYSHAEGQETLITGDAAHAEGSKTHSLANYAHSEGHGSKAVGEASHAEGWYTEANNVHAHAEGYYTKAEGIASHAEGYQTHAKNNYSHTEGLGTIAASDAQHVEGQYNIEDSENKYLHIIGNGVDENSRSNAHTIDKEGNAWFAGKIIANEIEINNQELPTQEAVDKKPGRIVAGEEFQIDLKLEPVTYNSKEEFDAAGDIDIYVQDASGNTVLIGEYQSGITTYFINKADKIIASNGAEIFNDLRIRTYNTNPGSVYSKYNIPYVPSGNAATGEYAHAEGMGVTASGEGSHAEGQFTKSNAKASHTEGIATYAHGSIGAHAEGVGTYAGCIDGLEGGFTDAEDTFGPHAEGYRTQAKGEGAHAEGVRTEAYRQAHAEGVNSKATEIASHAEGSNTIAASRYQHVQGKYNIEDAAGTYAHIVGNGTDLTRSNAHTLDWDGNAYYAGNMKFDGKMIVTSQMYGTVDPNEAGVLGVEGQIYFVLSDD